MTPNKLPHSLGLCLLVISILLLLSFIPEFTINGWKFRRINLLAEITASSVDTLTPAPFQVLDSLQAKADSTAKLVNTNCKKGITCIEDYSGDSTALRNFLKSLHRVKNNNPLRIAVYGDSFIEGDVFCGSLRDTLQNLFRGNGVGFVSMASEVAGFRTTIKHNFDNWKTYSLMSKKDSTREVDFGPAGYCFRPKQDNWVEYKVSYQNKLREFNNAKLYYKNSGKVDFSYIIDETDTLFDTLQKSERLQEWTYSGNSFKSIRFEFPQADSAQFYGVSFENKSGICVDNFSMRGHSGAALLRISDDTYSAFNKYRDYKLVILQYGLNVVVEDSLNYKQYALQMVKVVNKLKRVYPEASILLISVSDRSSNSSGEYKTMKAIPAMRNAQRSIARQTGIAFWDLYEAMGGENSMVKLVEAKPSLASKDYTHLTFKGGRKLSRLLVKSLLYEFENYEKAKR